MLIVCATFFARHIPLSTSAKPACMNITRNPAISVQMKLIARECSSSAPVPGLKDDTDCAPADDVKKRIAITASSKPVRSDKIASIERRRRGKSTIDVANGTVAPTMRQEETNH